MKLKLDGFMLYLGRLRRDGTRNVERVRMDWRTLLPKLRRAKIKGSMVDSRLYVTLDDDRQLKLSFMSESA